VREREGVNQGAPGSASLLQRTRRARRREEAEGRRKRKDILYEQRNEKIKRER
jgi:hypothetical protein